VLRSVTTGDLPVCQPVPLMVRLRLWERIDFIVTLCETQGNRGSGKRILIF